MGFHLKSARRAVAIWSTVTAILGLAILQPSAYGLEFSASTSLILPTDEISEDLSSEAFLMSKRTAEDSPADDHRSPARSPFGTPLSPPRRPTAGRDGGSRRRMGIVPARRCRRSR